MRNGNDFLTWIENELKERDWKAADLSKRAAISDSTLSRILNRERQPNLEHCLGIARAFHEPPERVLRLAGLLPPLPAGDAVARQVAEVVQRLPAEEQALCLWFVQARAREVGR